MLAKILVIQFRQDSDSVAYEKATFEREVGAYVDLGFIGVFDDAQNWNCPEVMLNGYQGVLLGGSGEFDFDGNRSTDDPARVTTYQLVDKLKPVFSYIFDHDIPTLGICFGHQLLGAFAGAQVSCDEEQRKTGSHELKLMVNKDDNFLFADLPETFFAHYGHKDSLDRVPTGATLLLCGEKCKVSALRYKNNIFSTQFHTELTYERMVCRVKQSPGYLPEGVIAEELFRDAPHSNTILHNFGKFVALQNVEK
jgi:GMP synthase (glutamine-hydrolysing)